jgi:hypothetical protein
MARMSSHENHPAAPQGAASLSLKMRAHNRAATCSRGLRKEAKGIVRPSGREHPFIAPVSAHFF